VAGRVTLGEFVLDVETRELLRGSSRVPLSPKAFQLLAVLVESRPKALSKHDLQERLWPGTFVVEKNLTNLIAEIREALGDNSADPRFIRTVHRFGYACRESPAASGGDKGEQQTARFRLTWTGGHAALGEGEYILGRDPDLELFLDSPSVSRRHARLRIAAGQAMLEDLGSKNGTFVGNRRIESPARLAAGDSIRIGSVNVALRVIEPLGSTETRSVPDG
jgi:DNA-binding winged helix-turn-helix (wHTH) protein